MKSIFIRRHLLLAMVSLLLSTAVLQAAPVQRKIHLTPVGSYATGWFGKDVAAATVLAYDPTTRRVYVVNAYQKTLDVLSIVDPAYPAKVAELDLLPFGGGVNSVAVRSGLVAVAVGQVANKTEPGVVLFFDRDLNFINSVSVGALPDMLTFSPNGRWVLVANEGEPNSYGKVDSVDPEGSISVIDLRGGAGHLTQADVRTAGFTLWNGQEASLASAGIRIFGSERLLQECNPWITSHTFGRLERATNYNGLGWLGFPFMAPFLRSTIEGGSDFAFGGFFVHPFTNRPPPGLLFQQVTARTNLVYYDWEVSALRMDQWLHIGQLLRLVFNRASLPPNSASMAWLNAAKTNLSNCVTGVGVTGPAQLAFTRVSTAGLTALEMHLLADWLESPQFPRGLNTFFGPQRAPPRPGMAPPSIMHAPKPASAPGTKR